MYQLTITEKQAEVLGSALDLYSRIGIGQLEAIEWIYRYLNCLEIDKLDKLRENLEAAKKAICPNGSYSILNGLVNERFRIAFDLEKVISHQRLDGVIPFQDGSEPLASIVNLG